MSDVATRCSEHGVRAHNDVEPGVIVSLCCGEAHVIERRTEVDVNQEARSKVAKRLQLAAVQVAKAVEVAVKEECASQDLFELAQMTCRVQQYYSMPMLSSGVTPMVEAPGATSS